MLPLSASHREIFSKMPRPRPWSLPRGSACRERPHCDLRSLQPSLHSRICAARRSSSCGEGSRMATCRNRAASWHRLESCPSDSVKIRLFHGQVADLMPAL